jgi:hypothetical protein
LQTGGLIARTTGQQGEASFEPGQDRLQRQMGDAGRGELDGEG